MKAAPPARVPARVPCLMGRVADGSEDTFLKADTAVTILPFPPDRVPEIPPLLYVDVDPRAHREWTEGKSLRWEPLEDRYYYQLRFERGRHAIDAARARCYAV